MTSNMKAHITFISAGAGSGKTHRLTEILHRELTTGGVRPAGVIATTFTRKAATELRERGREHLLKQGSFGLANAMGQARIGTVNGVCGQLIARFAFEAGMSTEQQVLEEVQSGILLGRAIDAVLDGPFGRKLMDYMPAKGWVGLGFMEQGYRSISNSKRPITKLEDIKGLKIRTILNPLYVDMLNTLGANAVPMPFPELYSAMETKTVDGQENPETTVDASKFYEVQKYFSATRHIYNPQMVMVSKKFWDSLSADETKIFEDAMVEARDVQRKAARAMTDKSRKVMLDNGMKLNEIEPAELARMRAAVKPVTDKYAAQLDPSLVKAFQAELERTQHLK